MMPGEVIYSCPFVPQEYISACGMTPKKLIAASSASRTPPGVCTYAHAFATEAAAASSASAIVMTTMCDQMRRRAEIISRTSDTPVFLMNVPHTWQTPAARELYIKEIKRLGAFLEMHGGQVPTPEHLAEVMSANESACVVEPRPAPTGIPIALLGGPLPESSPILDLIGKAGAYVALDGTETGERTRHALFDSGRVREDPLGALADAYFTIPDPFRRPNDAFFEWLKRGIEQRGVCAVIVRRYVWCDNWHAETQRIRELTDLPFLSIDVGDEGDDPARLLTRLQCLVEMLQ